MTVVATPQALDSDVEDVAWALQTAGSLWKRGERVDAIVWLRRAAQAAGDAQQDERALALARAAAELSDWIAKNPVPPPSAMPSSIPPNDSATGGVDDLLRSSMPDIPVEETPPVSMSAMTEPHAFMPVGNPVAVIAPPLAAPPPVAATPPLPPTPVPPPPTPAPPPLAVPAAPAVPIAPTTADLIPVAEASSVAVYQSVTSERSSENVQSAAEAHAGMLDPWSPPPEEYAPPKPVLDMSAGVVSSDDYDDEVVTSARLPLPPAEPAVVIQMPNLPKASPPAKKPPPPRPAPSPPPGPAAATLDTDEASTAEIPALSDVPTVGPPLRPSPPPPPVVAAEPRAVAPAPRPAPEPSGRPRAAGAPPAEPTLLSPGTAPRTTGKVDLASIDALTDLPDDAREELERVATVHHLARDEEVMGFALAYVVEGEIDVAAQIVDAPADRIAQGAVLKAKGTVAESVPLRLVCASDHATVATWDAEQIEPAFRACPWVEDDLRAAANRMQALVGVTLGPLADRLDAALRAQVTNRLELRELPEGEIIVELGEAVRDLCLVGQGSIELVQDGNVVGEIGVGEFLFPAEIMGGGKAGATARAGKGGALLLASDRAVAQELMVTCPPLLEIFAGM
jgi:hypothetical protein